MYTQFSENGHIGLATALTASLTIDGRGVAAFARVRFCWPRVAWSRYADWLERHKPLMGMVGQLAALATTLLSR